MQIGHRPSSDFTSSAWSNYLTNAGTDQLSSTLAFWTWRQQMKSSSTPPRKTTPPSPPPITLPRQDIQIWIGATRRRKSLSRWRSKEQLPLQLLSQTQLPRTQTAEQQGK